MIHNWAGVITIGALLVGSWFLGVIWLGGKMERQNEIIDSRLERQGERIDRLYEMFYDLIREGQK